MKNTHGMKSPDGFPGLPASWMTEWESVRSHDDTVKLFAFLHRKKEGPIRRVLVAFHGFGEHGGRYLHFPHYLEKSIDAIYLLDHRGHGRSDGIRGDAADFDALVDDMADAVYRMHEKFPEAKLYVFAHSFGGHLGIRLALLYPDLPVESFAISAPFLGLKLAVSPVKKAAAHLLSKVWGTLSLGSEFDANVLSRDPALVENQMADRLNHNRMTPRLYVSMTKAWKDTLRRRDGINYPIALFLPLADTLVDGAKSKAFFEQLENPQKKIYEFEGFRHEAMNDLGKERFFEKLSEWIDSHG